MNRSGLRVPKHGPKRLAVGGIAVVVIAAAIGAATNGFGTRGAQGEAGQRVNSIAAPFTISSPSIAGDPGGTSLTETVNDMYNQDYRERLVTFTPGAGQTPIVGLTLSAVKNSDNSDTWSTIDNEQPDALDMLQGSNDGVTSPAGAAPGGQAGLFVEAYSCSGTWSSAAGAVAAATDDRDYSCSVGGANGVLIGSYDVPASGSATEQFVVPPLGGATSILLRTRFTDDGSTAYRQAVQHNEQVTLTHRFDAATGLQISGAAEPSNHQCVVKSGGTLWCWGKNQSGELGNASTTDISAPTQIGTATDWSNVGNGLSHTCAVKTTGTIWCWGLNSNGQLGVGDTTDRTSPTQIGALTTWAQVSGGSAHTCAVKTDGTTWCWGLNGNGQLGDNSTSQRTAPVQAAVATDWANVQAGGAHTCARKTTRALWCWGNNANGQLGDNTTSQRLVPTNTNGANTTWDVFDLGLNQTCSTRTNGTLWCWGYNANGQFGKGDTTQRNAPSQVGALLTWNSVDLGDFHMCATKTDGTLWCAGANGQGELGQGTRVKRLAPTRVGAATTWSNISAQDANTCALRTDNTMWCWGRNDNGQIGDTTTTGRSAPVQIGAGQTWVQVAVANSSACARRSNNTLWCWGYNGLGAVGDGTTSQRTSPTQVGVATDWAWVGAGMYSICAVKTTGTLWCWGYNSAGQLGQGTTDFSAHSTPLQVGVATDWAQVSSTQGTYMCATKTTGTLWCWGSNWFGMLGDGTTTDRTTPTQVGALTTWASVRGAYTHTCATKTDNTLWCWGLNNVGQLGDGTFTQRNSPTQVGVATTWSTQIGLGTYHTCGSRSDGSLWCWGLNWSGALGLGDTAIRITPTAVNGTGWAGVAAGAFHSCFITGGWLYCTGNNTYSTTLASEYGVLGNAPTPDFTTITQVGSDTDWAAAYAGSNGSSCGRKLTTGYIWCWGSGAYNALGNGDAIERTRPNAVVGIGFGRNTGAI